MENNNRFKTVLKKMLVLDGNGLTEFDKIYHNASRLEKKKVKLDWELCKEFAHMDGTTIPIISSLKSREVMRDIITYLNEMD